MIFIQSFMKLYQLNHKSIVRTSYSSLLLDEKLSFFIIVAVFKNDEGYHKSYRSRYSLYAVNENVNFVFLCVLNELNNSIKQTLNILILRIFEKKCAIIYIFVLKPVLAIISCTINNSLNIMVLKNFPTFSHLLARNI